MTMKAFTAKKHGTINGQKVSIQCIFTNRTYCGINKTCAGSIMVDKINRVTILRPLN